MQTLDHLAEKIIQGQELIIGPLAWSEAGKVAELSVDGVAKVVHVTGSDQKAAIDNLVSRYERLFGRASHEVCREAVASLLAEMPATEIPPSLR